MQKILKRLELIKTAITLEDEEIIELQVMKLNSMEYDVGIKSILNKIEDKDYGNVVLEIESYLQKYSGMVVHEDKELQGLRLELKALEKKLQELSSIKNEYLNDINDFHVQYKLRLGDVIQKILNIKEELLQEIVQEKKDAFEELKDEYKTLKEEYKEQKSQKDTKEQELEEMDEFDDGYDELYEELQELKDELNEKEQELNKKRKETKQAKEEYEEDEVTQEYEEVKQDSEEFSREYEEVKQEERFELNDDEKQELKKLFRKASRICHPDIVSDELKEQAHGIMQQLNEAYKKRDLKAVKEMLISLESGKSFDVASDTIDDKDLLRSKIVEIREMIYQIKTEIETIEEDEAVQILNEYDDIKEYLSALEEELESEYERLKNRDTEILTHKEEEFESPVFVTEEDAYWGDEF